MELSELGLESIPAIAILAARAVLDPPTENELHKSLTAPDQPATVRGDPRRGVVATVTTGDQGFVRFIAVDPTHRRQGIGRALLAAAETDLRAVEAKTMTIGADAPYYLWPGIDSRELAMVCLAERSRFSRVDVNLNMDVDLERIPADPGGWRVATEADRETVALWASTHWEWWRAEMVRAADQGSLLLAEAGGDIIAVCAYDVNRGGQIGPVAVRPDLMGRGVGVAPLVGALHRLRSAGRTHAEVAWVGPVAPYARIGATFGRHFLVYQKLLT